MRLRIVREQDEQARSRKQELRMTPNAAGISYQFPIENFLGEV
jgi:hypothetical protein